MKNSTQNYKKPLHSLQAIVSTSLLCLALSGIAASAYAGDFESSHSFVPTANPRNASGAVPGASLPVVMGQVTRYPALESNYADGTKLLTVKMGKARSMSVAESLCDQLAPAGKFRLPDPLEMLLLLELAPTSNAIKLVAQPKNEFEATKFYAYWTGADPDDAADSWQASLSAEMKKLNQMVVLADGHGMDSSGITPDELAAGIPDSALSSRTGNSNYILSRLRQDVDRLQAKDTIAEQLKDGVTVFCVASSAKSSAAAVK